MNELKALIPYSDVENKIATIRKQNVMADADVAELYGVETRRVNEAVRNNPDKFPSDYMFELTTNELRTLRSKYFDHKSVKQEPLNNESLHRKRLVHAGHHTEKRESHRSDICHH